MRTILNGGRFAMSRPPQQLDRAIRDRQPAADQVEQGRLAGAVRADDGMTLALFGGKIDTPDDVDVVESLAQTNDVENRAHCALLRPACSMAACQLSLTQG